MEVKLSFWVGTLLFLLKYYKGHYFLYKIKNLYFEFYYFDSLIIFFDKNFINKNLIIINIDTNIKKNTKVLRIIKNIL